MRPLDSVEGERVAVASIPGADGVNSYGARPRTTYMVF